MSKLARLKTTGHLAMDKEWLFLKKKNRQETKDRAILSRDFAPQS